MAYIVDYALTYGSAAAVANVIQNMPLHQTNDLLLAIVTMNSGAASVGTGGTAGWSAVTSNATNTSNTMSFLWLKATAATNTLSLTTADDYCCTIISIRDQDLTTPIDVNSVLGSTTSTSTPTNVSVTTTTADCLIIYMMAIDGIATAQHTNPGIHHLISYDNQGTTAATAVTQGIGWYVQRTAGATPAPGWTASAAGVQARATIAIRNKVGGKIPAYIDDISSPATMLLGGHHTATLNGTTFTGTLTATGNMTNGKTTSYVAVSTSVGADLGINPFSYSCTKAAATQAKTALTGFEISRATTAFTTGLLVGSVIGGTPKMGTFGIGSVDEGGCVIRVGTAAGTWNAYQVAAKNSVPNTEARCVFAIDPTYTGTRYGSAGTYTGASATQYIQFLSNQPSFASSVNFAEVYQAFTHVIAGGDSVNPVDSDGLADVGKSYRLPVIQKSGGYGILSYVPLQIGGGDAVNFQIDAGALQFPRRYNTTTKEIAFHAGDNKIGISYAGKTGDVIKHTNSVITSPNRYYWEINSAATSAATWDFSGLVVVDATVTLRPVTTFDSMSFSNCVISATNGSTVTNSTFSASTEFTASSGTFTACTFTKSAGVNGAISITGASQAAIQTELNKITNCNFTGNTTPLGALRIIYTGAAGAINLSMSSNSFSGNTKDIRWEAPAGSNLTLNLSGTASVATFSATNANTVTFVNTKTLTLTGLLTGSDIVIKTSDTNTALVNIDANVGSTYVYSYTYVPATLVDIKVQLAGYKPIQIYDYLLTNSDSSLPIAQEIDRAYQ